MTNRTMGEKMADHMIKHDLKMILAYPITEKGQSKSDRVLGDTLRELVGPAAVISPKKARLLALIHLAEQKGYTIEFVENEGEKI